VVIGTWGVPFLNQSDMPTIMKNAVNYTNAHGGLGTSHTKVQVVGCNDNFVANEAVACARQAVSDHALAVIGFSQYDQDFLPMLESAHIARMGDETSPNNLASPVIIDNNPGPFYEWAPLYQAAKNCKSVAFLTPNLGTQLNAADLAFYKSAFTAAGNPNGLAKVISLPITATDMTPYMVQIEQSGAQCIGGGLLPNQLGAFISAEKSQGIVGKYPVYWAATGTVNASFIAQNAQATNNWHLSNYYQIPSENPAWAKYVSIEKAAKNLGADTSEIPNGTEEGGYAAWMQIVNATKNVSGPITSAAVLKALTTDCSMSTGGLLPTLNFCKKLPYKTIANMYDPYMALQIAQNGTIKPWEGGAYYNVVNLYEKGGAVSIPNDSNIT
jgi:hypothetical protein